MKAEEIKVHSKVRVVPTGSLKPNSYNPNVMSPDMLASVMVGIQRDGFLDPILVQKGTNIIIDGEHRHLCATKLHMKHVPIIELGVNDTKAKELTIALNQKRGYFDDDKLGALVQEIADVSEASRQELQVILGLSAKEIDSFIDNASAEEEAAEAENLGKETGKPKDKDKGTKEADISDGESEGDIPESAAEDAETPDYGSKDGASPEEDKPGKFPLTFYAPTLRQYGEARAFFLNEKTGEMSFGRLQELIDFFHRADPDAFVEFCEKAKENGGSV